MKKVVNGVVSGSIDPKWGNITGNLEDQIDLISYINTKDAVLRNKIDNESSTRQTSFNDLSASISKEKSSRETQYNELNDKIANEAKLREQADIELDQKTSGFDAKIEAEKSERKQRDFELSNMIGQEVSDRKAAINGMNAEIDLAKENNGIDLITHLSEVKGVISGSGSIHLGSAAKKETSYFDDKINKEVSDRTTAVSGLSSSLNQEREERINKDTELETKINNEVTLRSTQISTINSNLATEKTQRETEDTRLNKLITDLAEQNDIEHAVLNTKILNEEEVRRTEDGKLQARIDAISIHSSFIDVLNTFDDLRKYDTSKLITGDVIRVIHDETKDGCSTNYKWDGGSWVLIGSEGPYYTKEQTDSVFVPNARKINNHELISDINLTYLDVGAMSKDVEIGKADLILTSFGTEIGRFNANQVNTKTIDLKIPSKASEIEQDPYHIFVTSDQIDSWDEKQDALISGTNIKTVNGKNLLGSGNVDLVTAIDDVKVNGSSVVDNKIAKIIVPTKLSELANNDLYATQAWVTAKNYLTSHQSLDAYAKQQWVLDKNYLQASALNPYATKNYVDTNLALKQDKLTAGTGINITNNVISATGTGGISDVKIGDVSTLESGISKIYSNTAYNKDTNKLATMADVNSAVSGVADVKVNGESVVDLTHVAQVIIPVEDVKIGNTSIVDENLVATIPVATNLIPGIVYAAAGTTGVSLDLDGKLILEEADSTDINGRVDTRKPINPHNLDYAVKRALCDGTGPAYTETEQNAAKQRLGLDTLASTDVKINGTSITQLGVANIQTNTTYDPSNNPIATMQDVGDKVTVSATGTATDTVSYITINGTQKKLAGGSGAVESVNGKTGAVVLKTSDIANDSGYLTEHQSLADYRKIADQNLIDSALDERITAIEGKEAGWDAKSVVSGTYDDTNWTAITIDGVTKNIPSASVTSVNSKTGAVSLNANDVIVGTTYTPAEKKALREALGIYAIKEGDPEPTLEDGDILIVY